MFRDGVIVGEKGKDRWAKQDLPCPTPPCLVFAFWKMLEEVEEEEEESRRDEGD